MSESLSTQTSSNVHFQIARQCARCRLDYSHRSRVVLQSIVWHWFTSRPRNYNQHMPPDVHFCALLRLRSGFLFDLLTPAGSQSLRSQRFGELDYKWVQLDPRNVRKISRTESRWIALRTIVTTRHASGMFFEDIIVFHREFLQFSSAPTWKSAIWRVMSWLWSVIYQWAILRLCGNSQLSQYLRC